MASINPHQMMTCPYNKSHQVEHYRLQYHLEKCRKQHTSSKKVRCPFDNTHVVNEAELDFHVTVCPKRDMFDREAYIVDDTAEFTPSAQPPPAVFACPDEENWDNDLYNSYQPDSANQKAHIIRKIKGATPSERRKARMEGVKNFKPLEPTQPGPSGEQ